MVPQSRQGLPQAGMCLACFVCVDDALFGGVLLFVYDVGEGWDDVCYGAVCGVSGCVAHDLLELFDGHRFSRVWVSVAVVLGRYTTATLSDRVGHGFVCV